MASSTDAAEWQRLVAEAEAAASHASPANSAMQRPLGGPAAEDSWPLVAHMLTHVAEGTLAHANALWSRLPEAKARERVGPRTVHEHVLCPLLAGDEPAALAALSNDALWSGWASSDDKSAIAAARDAVAQRVAALASKCYKTVPASRIPSLLAANSEEEADEAASRLGWVASMDEGGGSFYEVRAPAVQPAAVRPAGKVHLAHIQELSETVVRLA
ncbi:hypothetical protein PPROV_000269500 [Pycnococcus provasolii]|uniref:CSN8/PSMD8/EIF3K domain-containing protein n=1 Tax=Pycnococcus provasolii TaxID=41880 RepID=A0A830HEC9_9CHLO|nr:hypothetical protein PPROV_000269500 [Pycnococcus provasolii]|mmetsp:Transcript_5294/g.13736  ORF Transcript_5294/g.13736 Transcript_5294/m.13736 type:complete len:216 (-) Transcript_5294:53-700(-)